MGSYDPQPADWNDYADMAWMPPHAIYCNSKWSGAGADRHAHSSVAEVRSCFAAAHDEARGIEVWPCTWLIEARYDDGSKYSYDCAAPARSTDRGYTCDAGHEHVTAEIRQREGWDYAEDEEEAHYLRKHGVDAVAMNGGSI